MHWLPSSFFALIRINAALIWNDNVAAHIKWIHRKSRLNIVDLDSTLAKPVGSRVHLSIDASGQGSVSKRKSKPRSWRLCDIMFGCVMARYSFLVNYADENNNAARWIRYDEMLFEEYQWNRQTFKTKLINYLVVRYHFGERNESLSEQMQTNEMNSHWKLQLCAACCTIILDAHPVQYVS